MKDNKLKKFETIKDELPVKDTDEEFSAFISELIEIGEKVKPNPAHRRQTTKQMIDAMNNPVVIVQTHDGRRISIKDGVVTEIGFQAVITENSTFGDAGKVTKEAPGEFTSFTDDELKIIEELKNG